MTDRPTSGTIDEHSRLAWAAVGLAGVAAALVALGLVGAGGAGAGVMSAVAAFVAAVVARVRHEHWTLLWVPLLLLPALVATAPWWV